MPLRFVHPTFPLSQYIECIRFIKSTGVAPSLQPIYPCGSMELVIHLEKPTMSFYVGNTRHTIQVPLLAGPYSHSFRVDPSQSTAVIGIRFRPGAARLFFPIPAHELHNIDIALSQLYPAEADRLLNELSATTNEQVQMQIVERYLNQKLAKATPIHPSVRYAVEQFSRTGGLRRIAQIQSDTGLSHTRFIDLFREHVGLTPKLFCRVRRFRNVIDRIQKGVPVNWANLAADCGYFDQAHLIRDFRAFAGTTPLAFSKTVSDPSEIFLQNMQS